MISNLEGFEEISEGIYVKGMIEVKFGMSDDVSVYIKFGMQRIRTNVKDDCELEMLDKLIN